MSVNSNAAKLLDMLKSASTPPPNPSSSTSTFPPPSSDHLGSNTSPPQGAARESSPFLPTSNVQSVSLQDLFAGIAPPPGPSPQTSTSPSPPVQMDHTASLMGLLNGIGGTSSSSNVRPVNDAPTGASNSKQNTLSPPPSNRAAPSSRSTGNEGVKPAVQHQVNLLNLFKSPSQETVNHSLSQPVIQHPTGLPSRPLTPGTHPNTPGLPPSVEPIFPAKSASAEPATTQPPVPQDTARRSTPPTSSAPSKSIFDFVSPFDVFDKPKTRHTPTKAASPAPPPPPPAQAVSTSSPKTPSVPSPAPSSIHSDTKPAPQSRGSAQKSQHVQTSAMNIARQRQPSGAASVSSSSHKDYGLPWLLNKVIAQGTEGKGPKPSGKHIVVDLSKGNVDSLVNFPGVSQITPTTILKQDSVGFGKGRSVALTSNWMAYAMTKGRIRIIDMASGSRCLLSPTRPEQNEIIDLAATAELIAVLYSDHSVLIWRVPVSWDVDNPETKRVLHIRTSHHDEDGVGTLNKVEWVKKDDQDQLVLGGDHGVVIVKIPGEASDEVIDLRDFERQKVLKTEGAIAAFCLNSSHQAIGLLSTKGQFTLYNVATLNRVWNRPLPSSSNKASVPSSVHFVESNILVGRASNTQFDLIQITTEIAVLSTIKFQAPPPSPPALHFSQVVYDAPRNTLFVAPFSRGSLFAFRYALKGVAPIKVSEKPDVIPFDKMAEYPLEPVLSLVLGAKPINEDAELFFATPAGFSFVHLDKTACEDLFAKAMPEQNGLESNRMAAALQQAQSLQPTKDEESNASAGAAPVRTEQDIIGKKNAQAPASDRRGSQSASPPGPEPNAPSGTEPEIKPATDVVHEEDLIKVLKRSEDKIANNVKQVLNHQLGLVNGRLDALVGGGLAESINQHVGQSVKAAIASTLQVEVKKAMGNMTSSLHRDVQNALQSTAEPAVTAALDGATARLEKSLQRSVASSVQQSVDRALADTLQQKLIPVLQAETSAAVARLSADVRSEIGQIRKGLVPRGDASANTDALVRALASSVTDLQKQVASLSEQLARQVDNHGQQAVTAPPPPPMAGPLPVPLPQHPQGMPMPPAQMLEDAFLSVLSSGSSSALVALVNDHWVWTESILPNPPAMSPLSSAVILTLLHRLALALAEMNPAEQNFAKLLTWERRVSLLLNPTAPEISSFYGRVVPIAQATLGSLLERTMRNGNGPAQEAAARGIKAVLDVLATKA